MSDRRLEPDARHSVLELLDGGVRLDRITITATDALKWAGENNIVLDDSGSIEAQINTARAARNLRLFRIEALQKENPGRSAGPNIEAASASCSGARATEGAS